MINHITLNPFISRINRPYEDWHHRSGPFSQSQMIGTGKNGCWLEVNALPTSILI